MGGGGASSGVGIRDKLSPANRSPDDDPGADQDDVLDDVLTLQRRGVRDVREDLGGIEEQWGDRAKHLHEEQQEGHAHEQAQYQTDPDQGFPSGKKDDGHAGGEPPHRERVNRLRRQPLRRAEAREELEDAEPEEDDAQADAEK